MASRIEQKLHQIGLSSNEAAVYLASLELGPATVVELAAATEVKRPTVYVAIETLTKKGLMSSVVQGKKTLFTAEDPKNLERIVEEAKNEAAQREEVLKSLGTELSSLFSSKKGDRPVVRFYEGSQGVETIRRDFEEMDFKQVCSIVDTDRLYELFPHQQRTTSTRIKKQIPSRVIYVADQEHPEFNDRGVMRDVRYLPRSEANFVGDITLYGSKVALTSFKGRSQSVVIESDDISVLVQTLFDSLWLRLDK